MVGDGYLGPIEDWYREHQRAEVAVKNLARAIVAFFVFSAVVAFLAGVWWGGR